MKDIRNNKGLTVIELVVTFALTMLISIFLFQIIITLKELYVASGIKTELLNKQALMSRKINAEFNNKKIIAVIKCGDNCLNFIFDNNTNSKLIVDKENNIFSYGDYNTKLIEGSKFGNINIYTETTLGVGTSKNNSIIIIKIPIIHNLLDEDYGINVLYQYNSRTSSISPINYTDENNVDSRIILKGSKNDIKFTGIPYVDPGYYVITGDNTVIENDPNVIVQGDVGQSTWNVYQITYTLKDNDGKTIDTIIRNVTVMPAETTFSLTNAIRNYNVPITGIYKLEAWGAQGGNSSKPGGKGAYVTQNRILYENKKLSIAVGGQGISSSTESCGGGGGTFIWETENNNLLIAAAGGGGGGLSSAGGIGNGMNDAGTGGTAGTGTWGAAGGAGWLQNGVNGTNNSTGGKTRVNGFLGGTASTTYGTNGGFGGGGGGTYAGGGGGGYTGGAGASSSGSADQRYGGSGGYSYYLDTGTIIKGDGSMPNQYGSTIIGNTGNGYAKITLISIIN